jgi:hypothetical protein
MALITENFTVRKDAVSRGVDMVRLPRSSTGSPAAIVVGELFSTIGAVAMHSAGFSAAFTMPASAIPSRIHHEQRKLKTSSHRGIIAVTTNWGELSKWIPTLRNSDAGIGATKQKEPAAGEPGGRKGAAKCYLLMR